MKLTPDLRDLLQAFADHKVEYLLIGGYAVSFHARPRFTKDIDLLIGDSVDNIKKTKQALRDFGAPDTVLVDFDSLALDEILYMGAPPSRIEIFKKVPGVAFSEAYSRRIQTQWDDVAVSVIGKEDLIAAKLAVSRPVDLLDVQELKKSKS